MAKTLETILKITGKLDKSVNGAMTDAQKCAQMTSGKIGSAFEKAAKVAAAAFATVKIGEAIGKAVEVGSEFEASMSQVAATMGITSEEINRGSESYDMLSEAAKKCGAETMYSASQAAEALNYLALAGYDAQKSAETLPKVLNLAAAGGLELGYASDLVTDSMAALGLETSQLDTYIDQMAKTSQKSNTSIAQLGEATLVTAGTASLAKMDIAELNTALGVLANNGIKGAEGGTHLRNVILSLMSPTEKTAQQAIKNLGLEITDSSGKMRQMVDIISDMESAMSNMSDAEKMGTLSKIFNKTDIAAVNALLKSTTGEFDALRAEVDAANGACAAMADTMNDNLKGRITILQSSLEGLGIATYDTFDDGLKKGVEGVTEAVGKLSDAVSHGALGKSMSELGEKAGKFIDKAVNGLIDALPTVIFLTGKLIDNADMIWAGMKAAAATWVAIKGLGVVTGIMGAVEAIGAATAATEVFNAVLLANPIGLVAAGAVALGLAIKYQIDSTKKALPPTSEFHEEMRKAERASHALTESLNESAETYKQSYSEMEAHNKIADDLVERIGRLSSSYDGSEVAVKNMQSAMNELNAIFPSLNASFDAETGAINGGIDALNRKVEALKRAAEQEAIQERMTELAKERLAVETKQHELSVNQEEATKKLTAARNLYNNAANQKVGYGLGQGQIAKVEKLKNEYMDAASAWGDANAAMAEQEENLKKIAEEEEYLADKMQTANKTVVEQGDTISVLGDRSANFYDRLSELPEGVIESLDKFGEELGETLEKQMSMFDTYKEKSGQSVSQIVKNMQGQIQAANEWKANLDKLSKNKDISGAFIQQLASMGIEGAGQVKQIADAAEKGGKVWEDFVKTSEEYANLIPDTIEGVQEAYVNAEYAVTESVEKTVDAVNSAKDKLPKPEIFEAWRNVSAGSKAVEVPAPDTSKAAKKIDELGESTKQGVAKMSAPETWGQISEASNQTFTEVQTKADETMAKIPESVTTMQDGWRQGWEGCLNIFNEVWTKMGQVAGARMNRIIDIINQTLRSINTVAASTPGAEQLANFVDIPHIAFAKGGTVTSPTMALIGEAGDAETIIPHNSNQRSRDLLNVAARGVYGQNAQVVNGSGGSNTVNVTFAPVINGGSESVKRELEDAFEEFKQYFEQKMRQDNREVFA